MTTNERIVFPHWVAQYCAPNSLVLDVGAGKGRLQSPAIIKQRVGQMVGVDPDPAISQNPHLDEWHCSTLEDFASESAGRFDFLYSMMVLEHITQPQAFFASCRLLLKPGGMFFAVTPNLWHYFGLATKISSMLKIEDRLLDLLIGKAAKEQYHFPTAYRANSLRILRRLLIEAGFREVEFRCFDAPFGYNYIIPKYLRWFPQIYSHIVYTLHIPHLMGMIMFRATV
jgi:SAM-dependent methyltransferase